MELSNCKRVWQHVFNQVIPFLFEERSIFQRLLLNDIVLLVLVEGGKVEAELVHPPEATCRAFVHLVLRRIEE
jgi:hypothetical protein